MVDSSKDRWRTLQKMGGGIRHIIAASQFMRRSKQVPACIRDIV